jgi:hypothetical protein
MRRQVGESNEERHFTNGTLVRKDIIKRDFSSCKIVATSSKITNDFFMKIYAKYVHIFYLCTRSLKLLGFWVYILLHFTPREFPTRN